MNAMRTPAAAAVIRGRGTLPAQGGTHDGDGSSSMPSNMQHRLAACSVLALVAAAIAGFAAPVEIDWHTSPLDLDLRGMNGEQYTFRCPPGKPSAARVTGSGPYTDASSICAAAVHAGSLRARDGGDVTIVIGAGRSRYVGSERNALQSAAYEAYWSGSFEVVAPGSTPASKEDRR